MIALDTQSVFEAVLGIVHGKGGDPVTVRDYKASSSYDRIAHRLGIAIILVGHWGDLKDGRKAVYNPHEMINTTKARLAGVTASITLGPLPSEEPGEVTNQMQLSVRGRDIAGGDQFLWLEQDRDTGTFRSLGPVRDVLLTNDQRELFRTIKALQDELGADAWVSAERVADELGRSTQAVKQMVQRIKREANVTNRKPRFGAWELESKFGHGYRVR